MNRYKARYKANDEGQGLFLELHLDEQFQEYSLEKTVDKYIESEVNLQDFGARYKNAASGQAAYNRLC